MAGASLSAAIPSGGPLGPALTPRSFLAQVRACGKRLRLAGGSGPVQDGFRFQTERLMAGATIFGIGAEGIVWRMPGRSRTREGLESIPAAGKEAWSHVVHAARSISPAWAV